MARKRKSKPDHAPRRGQAAPAGPTAPTGRRSATTVQVRKAPQGWELLEPRCALDRADDLDEVRKMIEFGETEVAQDELRWLLGGCSDFLAAHKALGEVALLEHDLPLARGHFGYAYQIGVKAFDRAGVRSSAPYALAGNQAFFEAAKGLAYALRELGKREMAAEVVARLLALDPTDPLGLAGLLPPAADTVTD